jgi:ubiquinone/menaquinone biosynthesis C-methylase UbiE
MHTHSQRYVPALGAEWLTRFYDPLLWILRERVFKRRLIEKADIRAGDTVLDLGCATATLTLMIRETQPEAQVVGLDPDPGALDIANRKAARSGLPLRLTRAMGFDLPYRDDRFDRVVSSLVFHHLTRENKLRTLHEIRRVLKPGGSLCLVDFGPPRGRARSWVARAVHHGEAISDNLKGRLPEMFQAVGLVDVAEIDRIGTIFGPLSFYRGRKPEKREH